MRAAIGERAAERGVPIELAETPTRYVAGEETALVHWLNGGDAKPTNVPPRPFETGVDGRPTLVQNVETLAHVAQIARFGAGWFREAGTGDEPGTTLVTVTGAVVRPAIVEVRVGTRIDRIVARAGGPAEPIAAFLVGGYSGTWLAGRCRRRRVQPRRARGVRREPRRGHPDRPARRRRAGCSRRRD